MMPKYSAIIFCDIDGTLTYTEADSHDSAIIKMDETCYLSKKTIAYINELIKKGCLFVLITGRKLSNLNNVNQYLQVRDYIIEHGSFIYLNNALDEKWSDKVKHIIGADNIKRGSLWDYEEELIKNGYKIHSDGRFGSFRILKGDLQKPKQDFVLVQNGESIDVIPAIAGKLNAIKYLIEKYHCDHGNTYAIGNDYNDLEMLSFVKHPYAPASAINEVKNLLQSNNGYIAKHTTHEGIAEILENILINFS